jgi:hypothetical protein
MFVYEGKRVRFVVELRRTPAGAVEGKVVREGTTSGEHFSGWLDLLRILENFDLEKPADKDKRN